MGDQARLAALAESTAESWDKESFDHALEELAERAPDAEQALRLLDPLGRLAELGDAEVLACAKELLAVPRACGTAAVRAAAARSHRSVYWTRREAARVAAALPEWQRAVFESVAIASPDDIGDILAEGIADAAVARVVRRAAHRRGTSQRYVERVLEDEGVRDFSAAQLRVLQGALPPLERAVLERHVGGSHAHARESATDGGEEPHAIRDPELAEITRAIGEGAVAATPAEAADLCRVRAPRFWSSPPEPPMHSRTNEASPEETRKETRLDELLRCLGDTPASLAIRQADVDGRLAALADDRVRELVARLLSLGRSEGNVADKVLAVDVLNEAFEWDAKGLDAAAACLPAADALLLRAHANTPDAEARRLAALGAMVAERVRAFEAGPRHNPLAQRARGRGSPAASSASRAKSSTPEYEDMIAEELRALLGSEEWTPARAGKLMAMLPAGRCMRLVAELDLGGPTAAIANRELRALAQAVRACVEDARASSVGGRVSGAHVGRRIKQELWRSSAEITSDSLLELLSSVPGTAAVSLLSLCRALVGPAHYEVTVGAVLAEGELEVACTLLDDSARAGLPLTRGACEGVLLGCAALLEDDGMSSSGAERLIGSASTWNRVDGLLEQAARQGITPGTRVFNALISAACAGGDTGRATGLLKAMRASGVQADGGTYAPLVGHLVASGALRRAARLIDALRARAGPSALAGAYAAAVAAAPEAEVAAFFEEAARAEDHAVSADV